MKTLLPLLAAGAALLVAQPASAAKLDTPWAGSGPGTISQVSNGTTADPQFDYKSTLFSGSWSYSTTAGAARTVPVEYESAGFYSWYQVQTKLERFIVRGGKEILTEQLKAEGPTNCCDVSPSGGFDYKGTTSFDVIKGDVYGFRMSGSHYTGGPQMNGSIFIREVDDSAPSITPVVEGVQGANGIYTGPVKVSWKLADPDSRILESKGCEAITVSEETAGKAITCAATSRGGKATKTVTVAYDATAPELTVPAAVAVQASTGAGAVVNYAASATDKLDPAPAVACTPASGSLLPVGTTNVTCTATDAAGNQTTKAFDALVVAPTPGATVLPSAQPGLKAINAVLSFRFVIQKQTTKLVQLKVKNVPKGATVLVRCTGSSCPKALRGKGRTLTSKGSTVSLATLIKTGLRKGTTINVTISSPGAVTAIKTLTVRKGQAPVVK